MPRRQSKFLFACARLTRETTNRNPKTDSTLRFPPLVSLRFVGIFSRRCFRQSSNCCLKALGIVVGPEHARGFDEAGVLLFWSKFGRLSDGHGDSSERKSDSIVRN